MKNGKSLAEWEVAICRGLVKYRYVGFLISLMICLLAGWYLHYLKLDTDPRLYFSHNDTNYQNLLDMQDEYGQSNGINFVMVLKNGEFFTRKNLALLQQFTADAEQLPYVSQVNSLSNYTYSWSHEDDVFVDTLISNPDSMTDSELKEVKTIAHNDIAITGRLFNAKGNATSINLLVTLPEKDHEKATLFLADKAHELAEHYENQHPEIDILLTGDIINNAAINKAIFDDGFRITPILSLITFALLALFLQSISAVFIIIILSIATIICAGGIAAGIDMTMTMLSVTSIDIILVIAIAHCVHILLSFLKGYREGKNNEEAMFESLRINIAPVFLTSITTMLGFISLNFSDMQPARDFGNITAIGTGIIFLFSMVMLPAMVTTIRFKRHVGRNWLLDWIDMHALSTFVIRHYRGIAIVCIAFALSMLFLSTQNVLNSRFTENIRKPHPFRLDNDIIDQLFGGFYSIEYSFHADKNSSISNPEYLHALDKFTQWLRTQPNVKNVFSYTDVIKRLNKNMHGDNASFYSIPDTQEEAAQYLLLMEMAQPEGAGMSYYVMPDHSATRLIVALPTLDSDKVIALQKNFDNYIRHNMPAYMYHPGTSIAVIWAHLGNTVAKSSIESALTSLALIFLLMAVIFRSLKYGLVSIIPNVLPMAVGYGIWAVYDGALDMNQLTVFSITLGIVVDDTIHFLSKYLRGRRLLGYNSEEAVTYTFEHVGQPLWITTAVLVTGFGMLMLSSFQPNYNLGFLASVILLAGLFFDYFLHPAVLLWIDKK